jgi:hypothetical protein
LIKARRLSHAAGAAMDIDETLVEALALAGKHEQVAELGERLIKALQEREAGADRAARVHVRIARAMVAASNWAVATRHLESARELANDGGALSMPAIGALAAHVAIGRGQAEDARALACSALDDAERIGRWDIACEALEVIGRAARASNDVEQAEAAFDRARGLAEEHGLPVWRLRAIHELGTIDLFTPGAGPERLLEARRLAEDAGAMGSGAMIDIQLAAMHVAAADYDAVLMFASRAAETARRLELDATRAIALLFVAEAHGRKGPQRRAMEAALNEALLVSEGDPRLRAEVEATEWGDSRAFTSLI